MLVSRKWLHDYVFLPDSLSAKELGSDMTLHTVEVEEVIDQAAKLDEIVVGKIMKAEKHPDADKLSVCVVDAGDEEVTVVCGGSNVAAGMKIALGKIGAKVQWHGEGDLIELKKTKIRGVESFGMICAAEEIGLGEMYPKKDEKEILDLSHIDAKQGTPLAQALELTDTVIDIDNKSMTHRPDLWGHYGLARELSAMYRKKLNAYNPPALKEGKQLRVEVDVQAPELCSRYMAVALDGIEVGPSPQWLQARLIAVGLRPINNIVDITNYVMFDIGQPMHAFDIEALQSQKDGALGIQVRPADGEEQIETLDGAEHLLGPNALVIADSVRPIAIAGIMGGQNTGVQDETTQIILESATFDATHIRRTSNRLGLRSDSSARFEKTLDPNNCDLALRKAVELIEKICPNAKVISNVADARNFKLDQGPIELSMAFLERKMGVAIDQKQVVDILERLGFGVKAKKDKLVVIVPTWRATKDISIPDDLVEEVARMYGYDNIPARLPVFEIAPPMRQPLQGITKASRQTLAHQLGFTEVYNYSFDAPAWLQKIGESLDGFVELENPIAKDRPLLRRHLYPNLLKNIADNLHRFEQVKIFEVGKVFHSEDPGERVEPNKGDLLPRQDTFLGIAYAKKGVEVPFYEVAHATRQVLEENGITNARFEAITMPFDFVHNGRCAQIMIDDQQIGLIAEFHPAALERMGIDERVCIAQVVLDKLVDHAQDKSQYTPVPQFPSVERDIAVVVKTETGYQEMVELMKKQSTLIESVTLFDVYSGEHVESGHKSMAYKLVYRSEKKTLTGDDVEKEHTKVLKALEKNFGAKLRS